VGGHLFACVFDDFFIRVPFPQCYTCFKTGFLCEENRYVGCTYSSAVPTFVSQPVSVPVREVPFLKYFSSIHSDRHFARESPHVCIPNTYPLWCLRHLLFLAVLRTLRMYRSFVWSLYDRENYSMYTDPPGRARVFSSDQ